MARWIFEPGHTAAEFRVRHMMVTWVRGHFRDVHGVLDYDPERPQEARFETTIDARKLCSGEPARDEHLKSADFLDVEHHPTIRFVSTGVEALGADELRVSGDLTIRGVTRPAVLDVRSQGEWQTPYWQDGADLGPVVRAGFVATTRVYRHDFGVDWNSPLPGAGLVVGADVLVTVDVEAIRAGPGAKIHF